MRIEGDKGSALKSEISKRHFPIDEYGRKSTPVDDGKDSASDVELPFESAEDFEYGWIRFLDTALAQVGRW